MSTKKLQIIDYNIKQAENADTVDGKHASDFAAADDVSDLQVKVGDTAVSEQISTAISEIDYPVDSVNGKTGVVMLTANDVGALPVDTEIPSISGLATETYVDSKVAGIVGSAPETLDTLNELSAALGNDPNFATTIATQIGGKVNKVDGKGLSTNDYTTDEKNKLAGIEVGANKTTVDTALSTTSTNPVQNKVVNTAISNLNTLVGDTAVSTQIDNAIANIDAAIVSIITEDSESVMNGYIPFCKGASDGSGISINDGVRYNTKQGTESSGGYAELILGNNIKSGVEGNKFSALRMYGNDAYFEQFRPYNRSDSNKTKYMIGATSAASVGSTNTPVYIDSEGIATPTGYKFSDYLPLSGGTLTNQVTMSKSSGDTYFSSSRSDLSKKIAFGISSAGYRGLYDTSCKWLIYADTSDNVIVNGTITKGAISEERSYWTGTTGYTFNYATGRNRALILAWMEYGTSTYTGFNFITISSSTTTSSATTLIQPSSTVGLLYSVKNGNISISGGAEGASYKCTVIWFTV